MNKPSAPASIIPGFAQLFEQQREKQDFLVQTSLIQKQINVTKDTMQVNLHHVVERGTHMDELEDHAAELLASSEQFKIHTMRWYTRWWYHLARCNCFPAWWFESTEKKTIKQLH